jgi:uncharacterized protein (TIGR04255 family)
MTTPYPHLSRAPITEALLDMRVELASDAALDQIAAAFGDEVRADFPHEEPIRQLQAQVGITGGVPGVTSSETRIGSIFWADPRIRAVQARRDGFSVNHLAPYKDWDALRAEAERYWGAYRRAARPIRVLRCGVRFINRIELPVGDELRVHLKTFPEVGGTLPPLLDEYLLRVAVPFGSRRAVITQATLPAENAAESTKRAIILDVDAFSDVSLAPDSPAVWAEFDELRAVKNQCFFGSLDESTWSAYR